MEVSASRRRGVVIACHGLPSEERHLSHRDGRQKSDPTSMTFPQMSGWGKERRVSGVTAMSGCLRSRRYGSQGLIDVVGQQGALRPLSRARAIDVTFNRELPMGHPQVLSGLIRTGCAYFTDKIRKGSWTCTGSGISFCW